MIDPNYSMLLLLRRRAGIAIPIGRTSVAVIARRRSTHTIFTTRRGATHAVITTGRRTAISVLVPTAAAAMPGRATHIFITGQLAVMILVERQQFGTGIGDLIGINDAIVIDIQRPDNGREGRMMTMTTAKTGSTLVTTRRSVRIFVRTSRGRTDGTTAIFIRRRTRTLAHVLINRELPVAIFIQRQ